MLLVFEGIDGSGKSTQARLLAEYLEKRGKRVLLVREPGGTRLGESLRSLILERGPEPISPETELFLFMAARSHLLETRIFPALRAGTVVISDRFIWSSVVYQGLAQGRDARAILRMWRFAAPGVKITRTFLIDVDPEVAFRRATAGNRMEDRGLAFQKRVRKGFLDLAGKHPRGFVVIRGKGSMDAVHERVLESLPLRGWVRCSSLK